MWIKRDAEMNKHWGLSNQYQSQYDEGGIELINPINQMKYHDERNEGEAKR